jgi:nucleotide-binding universal stress UspA family protein
MEPMTLVAATDFSDAARAAVDRAALIAKENNAPLTLAYAFDEARVENLLALATPKKKLFAEQPLQQAWENIRAMADELAHKHGIIASGVVAMGRASEAIAATANAVQASLIVLGPHGRRLGDWLYLGSTALGAARSATCPVLVVRNKPKAGYARCLVGTDFSLPSQRAAVTAARLFPSAAITLLHAAQSVEGPMLFTGALRTAIDAALAAVRVQARKRLAELFPAAQPGRLDSAARRVVIAPAHIALQRALKSRKFDVVALGRDSNAALAERVLGSVPANLLINSPTDVLIVP